MTGCPYAEWINALAVVTLVGVTAWYAYSTSNMARLMAVQAEALAAQGSALARQSRIMALAARVAAAAALVRDIAGESKAKQQLQQLVEELSRLAADDTHP